MVLISRPIAKSAAAALAAAAAQPRPQPVRPASPKPPQILQSGHAPAQLSFSFR
jgi:hypothetical protein